ncbi:MAG TPA: hypothetical protein VMT03_04180 [Polyangia bacterium]|nr:hypothetical protein [Polyangia bacterium]
MSARGVGGAQLMEPSPVALAEVKLEDVVISVSTEPRRADFGPVKLFVGGLGRETTTADLRTFFSRFGELADAIVIPNRSPGQFRGFGFVSYRDAAAADRAIKEMNGVEVGGHPLTVKRAEARPGRF